MKTVLAGLACSTLLAAGAAWAQTGQTFNSNTANGSTMNPKPSASHTTPAAPDRTATTGHEHKAQRNATQQEKCNKAADDKQLSGQARIDYLRSCPGKLAPR